MFVPDSSVYDYVWFQPILFTSSGYFWVFRICCPEVIEPGVYDRLISELRWRLRPTKVVGFGSNAWGDHELMVKHMVLPNMVKNMKMVGVNIFNGFCKLLKLHASEAFHQLPFAARTVVPALLLVELDRARGCPLFETVKNQQNLESQQKCQADPKLWLSSCQRSQQETVYSRTGIETSVRSKIAIPDMSQWLLTLKHTSGWLPQQFLKQRWFLLAA